MGRRHQRAHLSSLRVLMLHLLKWQFQPERRSRSWRATISRERNAIRKRENWSHNLQNMAEDRVDIIYAAARGDAADETRLPLSTFPDTCPYTTQELRDRDFLPE